MRPILPAIVLSVAAAVALGAPARAASEQIGVWTVTSEPSSTGASGGLATALSTSPAASLDDPSQLAVRCLGGRTEFMVGGAGQWPYTRRRTLEVTLQIDGGAPENSAWNVSTNGKAAFFDGPVEELLRRLPDAGKLRVVVTDAAGVAHENIFATTGFARVRAKIAEACGWRR